MKHWPSHLMLLATVAALLCGVASVHAATWVGGSGNWASDNWGLNAPDGWPGDSNYSGESAVISSGQVSLTGNLPNNVGEVSLGTSILNIAANMTLNNDFILASGSGGLVSTVNQTAGNVSIPTTSSGLQLLLYSSTSASKATYNLSGGSVTIGNRNLVFGRNHTTDTRQGTAVFSLSGDGSLAVSSSSRGILLYAENSSLLIDASGGAKLSAPGTLSMVSPNTAAKTYSFNATVKVSGYNALTSLSVGTMLLYQGQYAQGSSGTAHSTAQFVLDSNGVSPWTVTGTLNLGDGIINAKGELEVVPYGMDPGFATLFNYGTLLNGSFGDVRVSARSTAYTGVFTGIGDLSAGEYYLDYGDGSNDSIVLYFGAGVIPEPGTMMLIVLGGLGLFGWRTMRANEERRTRRRSAGWA